MTASVSRMSLAPGEEVVQVRLLQCITCRTIQVIPDWKGHPDDDPYLNDLVAQHGGLEGGHRANLLTVSEAEWEKPAYKREIVDRMWSGFTGFTPSYYDAKNTFQEDALTCWKEHRRPGISTHLCSDYRSPRKRIGNPAYRDRAKLAQELHDDNIRHSGPKVFLCQFCPYQSDVQRMVADKHGDFSDKLI